MTEINITDLAELTADLVAAYVSKNAIRPGDLPSLIEMVHGTLSRMAEQAPGEVEIPNARAALSPAVPIKKSVTDTHIVCLEDGLHFKTMKRHLTAEHGMTPEDYRRKWGLPDGG